MTRTGGGSRERRRPQGRSGGTASLRALRRTQLALIVILLGLLVAGRRISLFPIMTWPMYSTRTTPYPGPLASRLELRVIDRATGSVVARLDPAELVSAERDEVVPAVIREAEGEGGLDAAPAHRAYLLHLARIALPGMELDSVEAVRTEWEVEPLGIPPLARDRPVRHTLRGIVHPSP